MRHNHCPKHTHDNQHTALGYVGNHPGTDRHRPVNIYQKQLIQKRKKVILSRKYYLAKHIFDYAKTLTGGHFEASNNPDFSDPDTIHTISHWLLSADSFEIKPQKTYRYWRYVSAKNKGCNLAELAFYSDKEEKELTGTIIGTNASVRYDTMPMDKSKVFDKDILTYYEAPSTVDYPWVGLDFNKPVSINKIIYTPRNDDNNIHAGDLYELFYWEYNHWMLLSSFLGV